MITVACVLKTGGDYNSSFVAALRRGFEQHLSNFEFVCLTDDPSVKGVPLKHKFKGWFSKLEIFTPGLFTGRVLYVDLDTLVVGDPSEIASYAGPLAMLSDFNKPVKAQSGVMVFTPGDVTYRIWQEWMRDPTGHMKKYRGDGEFLHEYLRVRSKPDRLQELFPNQIVSYKRHAVTGPPANSRLVCLHGQPRPNNPKAGWVFKQWSQYAGMVV